MKLLWIGAERDRPSAASDSLPLPKVPSLVALALQGRFDAVILDSRVELPFSLPHVLAAADAFRRQGISFCLLLPAASPLHEHPALMTAVDSSGAQKRIEQTASRKLRKDEEEKPVPADTQPPPLPPLHLPDGMIPIIDVAGSQQRIGCTTQAVSLCQALVSFSLSPAVLVPPEQLRLLSGFLPCSENGGVTLVRSVPVVSAMNVAVDCFVRDMGILDDSNAADFCDADISVLVCGTSPWELPHTARALERLRRVRRLAVIASFSTGADTIYALLRKLRLKGRVMAAGWQPDPFGDCKPDAHVRLLLPLLRQLEQPELTPPDAAISNQLTEIGGKIC